MKQTDTRTATPAPSERKRAAYTRPELKEYGTVAAITAGLPANTNAADNTKTTNKTSLVT